MKEQSKLSFQKILRKVMSRNQSSEEIVQFKRPCQYENTFPFQLQTHINQSDQNSKPITNSMEFIKFPNLELSPRRNLGENSIKNFFKKNLPHKIIEDQERVDTNSDRTCLQFQKGESYQKDLHIKSFQTEEKGLIFTGNQLDDKYATSTQQENNKSLINKKKNEVRFEYIPQHNKHEVNHLKIAQQMGRSNTIFINFKMKEFSESTLNQSINAMIYGLPTEICIPSRRYKSKVLAIMSTTATDKLKLFDIEKLTEKKYDVFKISQIEYGITNEDHQDIKGIDPTRVISFLFTDKEEIECLAQFNSPKERDWFMQAFQYFIKQSHKAQIVRYSIFLIFYSKFCFESGNIFQLRNQVKEMMNINNIGRDRTYEFYEIVEIFNQKSQLYLSNSELRRIYFHVVKKILDKSLTSQKVGFTEYQKILYGKGKSLILLNNAQFIEVIDQLLDRSELYHLYEKAANIENLANLKKTSNFLSPEAFKQFISFEQKETINLLEISHLVQKIQKNKQSTKGDHTEDNEDTSHSYFQSGLYDHPVYCITKGMSSTDFGMIKSNQNLTKYPSLRYKKQVPEYKKYFNGLSFFGFTRYIYSKNNSIFDPKKLLIYQNMNRPINEYFVNSAKNIFQSNFDIFSTNKISGFNFKNNDRNFPLLYAVSKGARYIEIEVWDGEEEPVITCGPTMNTKIEISEFAEQLVEKAFVINPFPVFLNLIFHCSIKQSFKMKYQLQKIFGSFLFLLPSDYKDCQTLPSPNDLKFKIIVIGKLPPEYNQIIQENYSQNDVVKSQLESASQIRMHGGYHKNSLVTTQTTNYHSNAAKISNNDSKLGTFSHLIVNTDHNHVNSSERNLGINNGSAATIVKSLVGTNNINNSFFTHQVSNSANKNNSFHTMIRADGSLLTPMHTLSFHHLPEDSVDEELMEQIIQEEMDENINVYVAAGCIQNKESHQNHVNIASNLNSAFSSENFLQNNNIYSTQRRGNTSSVQAIDNFFCKNLHLPKFKKSLQTKYDETTSSLNSSISSLLEGKEQIPDESNCQFNVVKNEVFSTMKHLQGETAFRSSSREQYLTTQMNNHQISNNKNKNMNDHTIKQHKQSESSIEQEQDEVGSLDNKTNGDDPHYHLQLKPQAFHSQNVKAISSQKSLQFRNDSFHFHNQNHPPSVGSYTPNHFPFHFNSQSSEAFQIVHTQDYGPVQASNAIESIFSFYLQKMQNRKASLWEIYEISQRDLKHIKEKKFGQSVITPFLNIENFTKKFLMTAKPQCKISDSNNLNPVPLFEKGIQFIQTYQHTFDCYNLIYQSYFQINGGESCGYILKPPYLRNQYQQTRKSHFKFEDRSSFDFNLFNSCNQTKFPYSKSQERLSLKTETIENMEDEVLEIMGGINKMKISIISGFNIPRNEEERVDPYVELIVVEGDQVQKFKTPCVEYDNMNPQWNYDISFIITQASFCFLIFQCINSIHQNLLGWYSIPFTCIREGYRVVPLKDSFQNTIKNSYILCQVNVIKSSSQ